MKIKVFLLSHETEYTIQTEKNWEDSIKPCGEKFSVPQVDYQQNLKFHRLKHFKVPPTPTSNS